MHISTAWIYIAFLLSAVGLAALARSNPTKVAPFGVVLAHARAHPVTHIALLVI